MKIGKLIVVEGPDGVGKTTIANNLVKNLNQQGIGAIYASFPGKDPKTLGKLVYELHHFPESCKVSSITEESKQILHIAAQFDTIANKIKPALEQGKYVVLDRYWWSTLVYGITAGVEYDFIMGLIRLLIGYWDEMITPDLGILFTGDNPFTKEDIEKWNKLNNSYLELFDKSIKDRSLRNSRFLRYPVDKTKKVDVVTEEILEIIQLSLNDFSKLN